MDAERLSKRRKPKRSTAPQIGKNLETADGAEAPTRRKEKEGLPVLLQSALQDSQEGKTLGATARKRRRRREEKAAVTAADAAASKNVEVLSKEDFHTKYGIHVQNVSKQEAPPMQTFEAASSLGATLIAALRSQGYSAPTPVQAQTWPLALKGRDVVGIASTGSGKTCGYALPALSLLSSKRSTSPPRTAANVPASGNKTGPPPGAWTCPGCGNVNWPQRMVCNTRTCKKQKPEAVEDKPSTSASQTEKSDGRAARPRVLVLAPARELAQQIHMELECYQKAAGSPRMMCVYGGVPKGAQADELRSKGCDLLVATPGRCLDFLTDDPFLGTPLCLEDVSYFVLDEADRMLEAGFLPDLQRIVEACDKGTGKRQTLFFTATWPPEVQEAAKLMVAEGAAEVRVAQRKGASELSANRSVEQRVELFEKHGEKLPRLFDLLKKELSAGLGCIIFCKTKKRCDWLAQKLDEEGVVPWVEAIHSGKPQRQREATLEAFRALVGGKKRGKEKGVLVATNVAARGIHVAGVPLVVVYDFCGTAEYVHQVGRTGRAGAKGRAVTFYVPGDGEAGVFCGILEAAEAAVPSELKDLAKAELRYTMASKSDGQVAANAARQGVKRKDWERTRGSSGTVAGKRRKVMKRKQAEA